MIPSPVASARWRIALRLGANELRSLDAVPMLLDWANQVGLDRKHNGQLSLILGELFNNALDHGILHLDSALKSRSGGFERYLELRLERLGSLVDGMLEMELESVSRQDQEFLRIWIKDSGTGFDYENILNGDPAAGTSPAGRGLALVRSMGTHIDYTAEGREVTVLYRIS